LIQALKDKDPSVRAEAASALGNINDTRVVDPLIQALEDNDSDVQHAANDSLKKLGWYIE
jgi:HEAT repeat protein